MLINLLDQCWIINRFLLKNRWNHTYLMHRHQVLLALIIEAVSIKILSWTFTTIGQMSLIFFVKWNAFGTLLIWVTTKIYCVWVFLGKFGLPFTVSTLCLLSARWLNTTAGCALIILSITFRFALVDVRSFQVQIIDDSIS